MQIVQVSAMSVLFREGEKRRKSEGGSQWNEAPAAKWTLRTTLNPAMLIALIANISPFICMGAGLQQELLDRTLE